MCTKGITFLYTNTNIPTQHMYVRQSKAHYSSIYLFK